MLGSGVANSLASALGSGDAAGVEDGVDALGQHPLAVLFVGEREQRDGDAARSAVAVLGRHLVVGSAVGVAGEELVAVDPVLQRHRLALERPDHVAVVHAARPLALARAHPCQHVVGPSHRRYAVSAVLTEWTLPATLVILFWQG